jgi:hypothetical protein
MMFIMFTIYPSCDRSRFRCDLAKRTTNPKKPATFNATCRNWNQQQFEFFAPSNWFCWLRSPFPQFLPFESGLLRRC